MRIQQLPPAIANQIAAGEVIERPASVVKELLENSLDAGATLINLDIGYGGLNHIKISDNGSGIMAEDLPLAIAAHATSKITSLNDLYAISSMGFRGEALASIASVARVTLCSKPKEQEHAMMLKVQGSDCIISPCARSEGTTIEVCDLFFNAPVRKRFLKNERLEFQAIEALIKRFALAAPHIAIHLSHNNKTVFSLPAALNEQNKHQRMTKILGSNFVKNALFLDVEQGSMRLYGWISGVAYQRSQNDRQWVYINQRMVKDKLINHAIKQAYDDLLHPGRFPSCLLYFSLQSNEVDVNVHPTKHEVRFQQPRLVHDFFTAHLVKALRVQNEQYNTVTNNEVCEPAPQFIKKGLKPSNSVLTKPSLAFSVRTEQPAIDAVKPWIMLNKQYALLWLQQQPFLVDLVQVYQAWLKQYVLREPLALEPRPLLVSVRTPLTKNLKLGLYELQHCLLALGVVIEEHTEELMIRTVPIALPYLDLKLFFARLDRLQHYDLVHVAQELLLSQVIDAQLLSPEEQAALGLYVLELQNNETGSSLFKPLTLADCRMLLDV